MNKITPVFFAEKYYLNPKQTDEVETDQTCRIVFISISPFEVKMRISYESFRASSFLFTFYLSARDLNGSLMRNDCAVRVSADILGKLFKISYCWR